MMSVLLISLAVVFSLREMILDVAVGECTSEFGSLERHVVAGIPVQAGECDSLNTAVSASNLIHANTHDEEPSPEIIAAEALSECVLNVVECLIP